MDLSFVLSHPQSLGDVTLTLRMPRRLIATPDVTITFEAYPQEGMTGKNLNLESNSVTIGQLRYVVSLKSLRREVWKPERERSSRRVHYDQPREVLLKNPNYYDPEVFWVDGSQLLPLFRGLIFAAALETISREYGTVRALQGTGAVRNVSVNSHSEGESDPLNPSPHTRFTLAMVGPGRGGGTTKTSVELVAQSAPTAGNPHACTGTVRVGLPQPLEVNPEITRRLAALTREVVVGANPHPAEGTPRGDEWGGILSVSQEISDQGRLSYCRAGMTRVSEWLNRLPQQPDHYLLTRVVDRELEREVGSLVAAIDLLVQRPPTVSDTVQHNLFGSSLQQVIAGLTDTLQMPSGVTPELQQNIHTQLLRIIDTALKVQPRRNHAASLSFVLELELNLLRGLGGKSSAGTVADPDILKSLKGELKQYRDQLSALDVQGAPRASASPPKARGRATSRSTRPR